MNKAAKIVSDLMLGERYDTVLIDGKAYTIYSPTIKILCRITKEFSKIVIKNNKTFLDVSLTSHKTLPHVLKGISYAIAGDCDNYEERSGQIYKEIEKGSKGEIKEALNLIISMLGAKDVFQIATSAKDIAEVAAKPKQ